MSALSATPARPILFSGAMVRAILDGTKTQTRRAMKPQPYVLPEFDDGTMAWQQFDGDKPYGDFRCPYGVAGDLLWVRETLRYDWEQETWRYDADTKIASAPELVRPTPTRWPRAVVPTIHMPRSASRLTLYITDVRVERLQSITEDDAKAEGVARDEYGSLSQSFKGGFLDLWKTINDKPGERWSDDPFVWVISFKVHHCNVDAMAKEAA